MTAKPRRRRARTALIALGVLLALCAWFLFEQRAILVTTTRAELSGLPAGFDGVRIVHLSDLHGHEFGEGNARLLSLVRGQQPDLIVMTGDMVDRDTQLGTLATLAQGLAAIAPTYYVTGNHEWALGMAAARGIKQTVAACGVTVLTNEYVTLERDGQTVVLAGIDDPNGFADQKTLPQLMTEIRANLGGPYVILLAHRNDGALYESCGVDLTLCGHAHGGLVRLPFTDGLVDHDRTFFPTMTAGLYQLSHGQMVVSRGLGNSGPSFRLFNRPHLPVVTLER